MSKSKPKAGCRWLDQKNCFEYRFVYNGKRYSTYGKTENEAIQKGNEKEKLLSEHMNLDNQKITLEAYYNEVWLPEQAKAVKESTLYSYTKPWVHIGLYFGKMRITDIQKATVIQFQKELSKKCTATTVNYAVKLLKQILNAAINDRIINFNSAAAVKNLKVEKQKCSDTTHRALSVEETKIFLKYAVGCHYYNLFLFLLNTGMRIGEALALSAFDIHEEISISKTISRTSNKGFSLSDTPKTSSSTRKIPITENIGKIVQQQKQQNMMLSHSEGWLFPNSRGSMCNYNNVDICISNIIKRINADGIEFDAFSVHAFRDTFATRCIEQGMQPQTLKALLGHSSLKMTMDLYAHVMPNTKAEELSKINIAV